MIGDAYMLLKVLISKKYCFGGVKYDKINKNTLPEIFNLKKEARLK